MKLLSEILYKSGIEEVIGSTHLAISSISFDSRKADRLGLFIAVKGVESDGHLFIEKAIEKGCCAVVCEVLPSKLLQGITYVKVKDSQAALGNIAANFYGNPSHKLKVIGVTGTNGKTTTATLIYQLLQKLGYSCGLISTVRYKVGEEEIASSHTTPDPITLQSLMSRMVDEGCQYCAMEVSSHAVVQRRINGVQFAIACFTNITHDHLDYHKTFQNYLKAKKGFFDILGSQAKAIINQDDSFAGFMIQDSLAKKIGYALKNPADYKCRIIESHITGNLVNIDGTEVWVKFSGLFNMYNVVLAYAVAVELGIDKNAVLTTLSLLYPVDGRFQMIKGDSGIVGIVDYAHTPDALENVLKTIHELSSGGIKIITVVGCGGDRDRAKRPIMAQIASKYSSKVILTSDNPRTENPESILSEMMQGIDVIKKAHTLVLSDRRKAIQTAAMMADKGDIILVAGKGHEKYQEVGKERFPFDDVFELTQCLNRQNPE